MRKLLAGLFLCWVVTSAVYAKVSFFNGTFEEASNLAKEENKLLYLEFFSVECASCGKHMPVIYDDSYIASMISGNFIALRINTGTEKGNSLKNEYQIAITPTVMVVNALGFELAREEYLTVESLSILLETQISNHQAILQELDAYNNYKAPTNPYSSSPISSNSSAPIIPGKTGSILHRPEEKTPTEVLSESEGFCLQLGAFKNKVYATKEVMRLETSLQMENSILLHSVTIAGNEINLLLFGHFTSREAAELKQKQLGRKGIYSFIKELQELQ